MGEPLSLSALLVSASARHGGVSGRSLAAKAGNQGFVVSHTTINAIRAGTYKSTPSPETLKAIAWLAGVPERVAFAAAGLPAPGIPFADELPDEVDQLSPKRRKVALEVLRSLIDAERQEHELEQLRSAWDSAEARESATVVKHPPGDELEDRRRAAVENFHGQVAARDAKDGEYEREDDGGGA